MVDDTGSKEEPTDMDSTKSPCPTPSNDNETENAKPAEGSRAKLNEESNDTSSIQNEEAVEEKSKTEEIDISDDERAMMVNMFKLFDSDGTGAMSIAELGNFMRAIGETSNDFSNATFVVINDHYDQACSQRMTRWTIC